MIEVGSDKFDNIDLDSIKVHSRWECNKTTQKIVVNFGLGLEIHSSSSLIGMSYGKCSPRLFLIEDNAFLDFIKFFDRSLESSSHLDVLWISELEVEMLWWRISMSL